MYAIYDAPSHTGPAHAFAYKVDRRLSSTLGEVASSHRPRESFMIDHQCRLWGGRSALPHVDLPPPASLSSSSGGYLAPSCEMCKQEAEQTDWESHTRAERAIESPKRVLSRASGKMCHAAGRSYYVWHPY
jgi:hypothetical protein